MTTERILEIINDREKCEFCPDCGDDDVFIKCERVTGISANELREYYSRMREFVTPLTPPQPLTLDELRGMDGKPVWVVTLEDAELNPPYWAIVDTANGRRSHGARLVGVENHDDFGAYELYAETWLAYPTEPGREP